MFIVNSYFITQPIHRIDSNIKPSIIVSFKHLELQLQCHVMRALHEAENQDNAIYYVRR